MPQPSSKTELAEQEDPGSFAMSLVRQCPSWVTSAVIHMMIVLVLALCVMAPRMTQNMQELVIGPADTPAPDLADADPPPIVPMPPTEVERDPADPVLADEPVTKVDCPEPSLENDSSAASLKFNPADDGLVGAALGYSQVPGTGKTGLGGRTSLEKDKAAPPGTINSVEAALKWLAAHQNADGSWSFPHTPGDRCNGFPNPGSAQSRMGATGLALLPFLGAGYTHRDGPDGPGRDNKYRDTVRRGVNYLIANMQVGPTGGRLFDRGGNGHYHMYSHGIAACALAEAYGMTHKDYPDNRLKQAAQLSLNYIYAAQHPESGGWLYEPRQGGDTSVVGWQIMAIKSGVLSYLSVPGQVKPLANKWLDSVSWDYGSSYGYRAPNDRPPNDACTAIGLLCRNYLGWKKDHPGLLQGVKKLSDRGSVAGNMYYNYYASMVMYQNDGPKGQLWKAWDEKMRSHLLSTQVKHGKEAGSWHFDGGHGDQGGRVYNTALAAMTLEVYYRYLPVYQQANVNVDNFPTE